MQKLSFSEKKAYNWSKLVSQEKSTLLISLVFISSNIIRTFPIQLSVFVLQIRMNSPKLPLSFNVYFKKELLVGKKNH